MTFAPAIVAAVLSCLGLGSPSQQATAADAVPVRVAWSALNPDGYAQVTLTNDSPLIVTAWAVSINITRPDGSRVGHRAAQSDFLGVMVTMRSRPNVAGPGGPLLTPGGSRIVPMRVDDPATVSEFSFSVDAAVLEDGTVLGDRKAVAMLLAARESDAAAAERWLAVFESAVSAADTDTAVGILQRAIGGLPSDRTSASLKSSAQQAVSQRANPGAFQAMLDQGAKAANVTITECRRHLGQ